MGFCARPFNLTGYPDGNIVLCCSWWEYGAVPAAAEGAVARDDRTHQTTGDDLATVVTRLGLVLEGTPALAASQRESDLRALSKLIRVFAEAIHRHLNRPAVSEKNAGDVPDEFVSALHEVIETITNRRQGARSQFNAPMAPNRTGAAGRGQTGVLAALMAADAAGRSTPDGDRRVSMPEEPDPCCQRR